jgi:hypothetical protein
VRSRSELGTELGYRSTSLIRNSAPPQDHHRALGIVLLQGRRGAMFFISEALLYALNQSSPIQGVA